MKRLLFVTPINPYPMNNGARIRIAKLLESFTRNWSVTVVSLVRQNDIGIDLPLEHHVELPNPRSRVAAKIRWAVGCRPYRLQLNDFRAAKGYQPLISTLAKQTFDRVFCTLPDSLVLPMDMNCDPDTVWFDQHNWDRTWCESFVNSRSMLARYYGRRNQALVVEYEAQAYRHANHIVSVSDADAAETRAAFPQHDVHVAPNGVAERFFDIAKSEKTKRSPSSPVLFVGSLDVEMNVEGLTWFVTHVWPRIRKQQPEMKLSIVGRNPSARVKRLVTTGVTLHANVPDVAAYYESSGSTIVPVRLGGGTKLKVLESLASGQPTVATELGLVGMPASLRSHITIADTEQEFADAVLRVHGTGPKQPPSELHDWSWTGVGERLSDCMSGNVSTCKAYQEAN